MIIAQQFEHLQQGLVWQAFAVATVADEQLEQTFQRRVVLLAQNPQDDEAAYQLAIQQLARQQYDAALEGLLKLFIRNRSYSEGLPHKTLLQVFELLGNDHPLVTVYRRKLFAALY